MVFPTLSFLVFYLVVWPLSWAAVALRWHRVHKLVIILASYVFYSSWSTKIMVVLLASVLLNWLAGRLIDFHRGKPAARWIVSVAVAIDVALFISFFAHLIAGPIVRASKFLPQLERPPDPNRVFVGLGVLLIGWGVFKKAVIANWLAVELVDKAFIAPGALGGADLLMAIYGYAVQIYCDFSAYSDIAIGVAALLGYR